MPEPREPFNNGSSLVAMAHQDRNQRERIAQLERLAAHLVYEEAGRCELTNDAGGRCSEKAVAARWEYDFCDFVCERHATTAAERGALVVHARRHDGTDGSARALGDQHQPDQPGGER